MIPTLSPADTFTEPTIRQRLESLDATRGFIMGAALSVPFWAAVLAALLVLR